MMGRRGEGTGDFDFFWWIPWIYTKKHLRIFFRMNPRKDALIHVYVYIDNAKSLFLKPNDKVHVSHYENLQPQKWKKNYSIKLNILPFLREPTSLDIKNHEFVLPIFP